MGRLSIRARSLKQADLQREHGPMLDNTYGDMERFRKITSYPVE